MSNISSVDKAVGSPTRHPYFGSGKLRRFNSVFNADARVVYTSKRVYSRYSGLELLDNLELIDALELLVSLNPLSTVKVSAGAEYSLDGGAWTSADGVWGTSKYIQIRGYSSIFDSDEVTHTVTIAGGLVLTFRITTGVEVGIPEEGCVFATDENLVDIIGESTIVYQSGSAATWATTAVWGFAYGTDTAAINTSLGGNKLFLGTTPIYRTWADWMDQIWMNATFLWMGTRGIAGYSTTQGAYAARINNYLNADDALTYDADLSLLWTANDILSSRVGPDADFASAGATADGNGSTRAANVPCVQTIDGRKVMWNGPAYSNLVPSAKLDITTWTQRGAAVVTSNGDGSYRVTVKLSPTQDIFFTGATSANPHKVQIQAKRVSGSANLIVGDSATTAGATTYALGSEWETCVALIPATGAGIILYATSSAGITVDLRFPQIVNTSYSFPYIAPGLSSASCAGTTGRNGTTFPMDFNTVAGQRLLETFRGVPDGTEIWSDATASGTNWAKTGSTWTHTAGNTAALTDAGKVVIGQRYLSNILVTRTAGSVVAKAGSTGTGGATIAASGTYKEELTCAGSTDMTFVPSSDFAGSVTVLSTQKLNPAVGSVAVLVRMGAGSAEIPNSTTINAITPNATAAGLLHSSTGSSGEDNIALSSDGATLAAVAATTWDRAEYHLKRVEFNGTKFRVGNRRYSPAMVPIDTNMVWSHATLAAGATFDGSFNPLTTLIQALNITVPHHTAAIAAWRNKVATDAEVYAEIHRKYPIGA